MDERTETTSAAKDAVEPGFTPLLTTTDWNAEWKQLQKARRAADSAEHWDKRAASFGSKDVPSPYILDFIRLMDLDPADSVLDMGCGNGGLALPLAEAGHQVIAADFSGGMLDQLRAGMKDRGLGDRIAPLQMSWADDWDAFEVGENCVDVAFASRSIATDDLEAALMKLNRAARKRCCVTLTTGVSPRSDARVLADFGLSDAVGKDFLYAFNILATKGFRPAVSYIDAERLCTYETRDEARASLERMIDDAATPLGETRRQAALGMLDEWLDQELVPNPNAGAPDGRGRTQGRYVLRRTRQITWAFISWATR